MKLSGTKSYVFSNIKTTLWAIQLENFPVGSASGANLTGVIHRWMSLCKWGEGGEEGELGEMHLELWIVSSAWYWVFVYVSCISSAYSIPN